MKKTIKVISLIISVITLSLLSLISYGFFALPNSAETQSGSVNFNGIYSANIFNKDILTVAEINSETTKNSSLKLFDKIPVKEISITKKERRYVIPGGELVGIKLKTKGVMIVSTESFSSGGETVCPAQDAGIFVGDILLEADGQSITNNTALTDIISKTQGNAISMTLMRDGKSFTTSVIPRVSDVTNLYKCGLWIRDCTSGIGTLTFADTEKGTIAALGHGIYDVDTNALMTSESGAFMSAKLTGVTKGQSGRAGEIRGCIGNTNYGELKTNCESGIYGTLSYISTNSKSIPVAFCSEVKTGKAQIICTVKGEEKSFYDIEIEKLSYNTGDSKNMVIKITDEDLIETTGGIVQGMSGSPIIQDGKLVGAVTHVFLNEPLKGYGIFAENMLRYSDELIDLQNAA